MIRRLSAICFAVWVMIGCGTGPQPSQQADERTSSGTLRIAVIPKGTTHVFWKSVHAGAVQAAEELGDVEIEWKGPLSEGDREQQINLVSDYVVKGFDGIVLAPLDEQALADPVQEAADEEIPVVIFDSGLRGAESAYVSYVATDNFRGGQLAADRLAEAIGGEGEVILLRYSPGSDSTTQREEGFLDQMQKHEQIEVISSNQYCGTSEVDALNTATNVLGKYQDQVDGVFAVCEPNATGTLKALKELELAGQVKFVAFDPAPELIDGLKSGSVHGIVLQDPVRMGHDAVIAIVEHIRGNSPERRINTGEFVATPENMNEERMQELLDPVKFEG